MKERPIIFNAEMVKAILDGRKTQTRRVMKSQPEPSESRLGDYWFPCKKMETMVHVSDFNPAISSVPDSQEFFSECCPFGAIGDRLWVRETWAEAGGNAPELKLYRANYPAHIPSHYENIPVAEDIRWTPSIHMPRWASRINLEITGVRVERLNDISEADALAEGMDNGTSDAAMAAGWYEKPQRAFQRLWTQIYGEESWSSNPWVWVIEFKRNSIPRSIPAARKNNPR